MYIEGDVPYVSGNYNNNGFGNGWEGLIGLALVASLFGGWGGGFGFGGGRGGYGSSELFGYQLGRTATSNDVASGFTNSEILSDLNNIILGQATMQGFINQGFAGLNTQLNNAICTLGYNTQSGFNALSRELSDCCCATKSMILENRYLNEKQTCDIITNQNAQTQRLIDLYTSDKINALTAENVSLKGRISNDAQTAAIVGALSPKQPIPAYPVFPPTSFAYPTGVSFGVNGNGCCGCGSW